MNINQQIKNLTEQEAKAALLWTVKKLAMIKTVAWEKKPDIDEIQKHVLIETMKWSLNRNILKNIKSLKEQQEHYKDFLHLITENPDLPIILSVNDICIVADGWNGVFGRSRIDEVIKKDYHIFFRSDKDDIMFYKDFFSNDNDFNEKATDEEVKIKVDSLPWMRCIVIDIETLNFDIPKVK